MKVKKTILKKIFMNFRYATETYSIVSCSTRDTSPRDLCMYNDFVCKPHFYYSRMYEICKPSHIFREKAVFNKLKFLEKTLFVSSKK